MKYVHPTDVDTYEESCQGNLTVHFISAETLHILFKNGNYLYKNGNIVNSKDSAAHIPLDEFIYGD